ncbi:DUF2793 domain-containing protein [Novosphingobium profundi]|uniref:DUF2793 domain-containing protein n=1 Tax=Novosphingobium profundi TaxID=1774954 RepID=UPI001BDAA9AC|nr:DUF2793 domain-containing protein [Novosphingobium profundi]MBT0667766.1 DUF2793 domain-containing protein [Novosphingobium profundi]
MTDSVTFDTASPRFGLPLLFQGQAQKEIFVNEAHCRTDALLHCTIESVAAAPPLSPEDGKNWLVDTGATGDWENQDGRLACRQAGQWLFLLPRDGLRIFDLSAGQELFFVGSWKKAQIVQEPNGGTVVDSQARAAVTQMVSALQALGILPEA